MAGLNDGLTEDRARRAAARAREARAESRKRAAEGHRRLDVGSSAEERLTELALERRDLQRGRAARRLVCRHRIAVALHSLSVGGHSTSLIAGALEIGECFRPLLGTRVVIRERADELVEPVGIRGLDGLSHLRVKLAPLPLEHALVDGLLDQHVPEHVLRIGGSATLDEDVLGEKASEHAVEIRTVLE